MWKWLCGFCIGLTLCTLLLLAASWLSVNLVLSGKSRTDIGLIDGSFYVNAATQASALLEPEPRHYLGLELGQDPSRRRRPWQLLPSFSVVGTGFVFVLPLYLVVSLALALTGYTGWRVRCAVLRGRREICDRCDYDLRGSGATCPECGLSRAQSRKRMRRRAGDRYALSRGLVTSLLLAAFLPVAGIALLNWFSSRVRTEWKARQFDTTEIVRHTAPRLSGLVSLVGPTRTLKSIEDALTIRSSDHLILLEPGSYTLSDSRFMADVAIVGVDATRTALRIKMRSARRVRLEDLSIDCGDDPFFEGGGDLQVRGCFIYGFNSGAGGSNSIYGSDARLHLEDCLFEGVSGRAGEFGHIGHPFDLRGDNQVLLRNLNFVDCAAVNVSATGFIDRLRFAASPSPPGTTLSLIGPFLHARNLEIAATIRVFNSACNSPQFVDDPAVVQALSTGDYAPLDGEARVSAKRLRLARSPKYWAALLIHRDPTVRQLAETQLWRLQPALALPSTPSLDAVREAVQFALESAALDVPQFIVAVAGQEKAAVDVIRNGPNANSDRARYLVDLLERLQTLSIPFRSELLYSESMRALR